MSQKLQVIYKPQERLTSTIIGQQIPVVHITPKGEQRAESLKSLIETFQSTFEEVIDQNLENAGKLEKRFWFAFGKTAGIALEYGIEVEKSIRNGRSVFEANIVGASAGASSYVAGSAGAAVAGYLVKRALPKIALSLGLSVSAPISGGIFLATSIGSAVLGSSWFDDSLAERAITNLARKTLTAAARKVGFSLSPSVSDLERKPFVMVIEGGARKVNPDDLLFLDYDIYGKNPRLGPGTYTVFPKSSARRDLRITTTDENLILQGDRRTTNLDFTVLSAPVVGSLQTGVLQVGNATLYTGKAVKTVLGSAANDNITGTQFRDELRAGLGNDLLIGGKGNDVLIGEDGNDILYGGDGDDTLTGGWGVDPSSSRFDLLVGGEGRDTYRLLGDPNGDNSYIGDGDAPEVEFQGDTLERTSLEIANINDAALIVGYEEGEEVRYNGAVEILYVRMSNSVLFQGERRPILGAWDEFTFDIYGSSTAIVADYDQSFLGKGFLSPGDKVIGVVLDYA